MTFYLTKSGTGITIDREPIRTKGKVTLTFKGEFADSVCIGGKFYPIIGGVCEIRAEEILAPAPVTAYALAERRRFVCDAIGRVGEGEEALLVPLVEDAEGRLASLSVAACELSGRMDALEERIEILTARINGAPFTIGGIV